MPPPSHASSSTMVNNLNVFYSRFNKTDFSAERDEACSLISEYEPIVVAVHEVAASLACIKPGKAIGPQF